MTNHSSLMARAQAFAAASATVVTLGAAVDRAAADDHFTADEYAFFNSGSLFQSGGSGFNTNVDLSASGLEARASTDQIGPASGSEWIASGGGSSASIFFDFSGDILKTIPAGDQIVLFYDIDLDYSPEQTTSQRGEAEPPTSGELEYLRLSVTNNNIFESMFIEPVLQPTGEFNLTGAVTLNPLNNDWGAGDEYRVDFWLDIANPDQDDQLTFRINALGIEAPAPGAVGLLGVAGIAASRRRRR